MISTLKDILLSNKASLIKLAEREGLNITLSKFGQLLKSDRQDDFQDIAEYSPLSYFVVRVETADPNHEDTIKHSARRVRATTRLLFSLKMTHNFPSSRSRWRLTERILAFTVYPEPYISDIPKYHWAVIFVHLRLRYNSAFHYNFLLIKFYSFRCSVGSALYSPNLPFIPCSAGL